MDRKYYLEQNTPHGTARLWVSICILTIFLPSGKRNPHFENHLPSVLDKLCCWSGADKQSKTFVSWEFPREFASALPYIMTRYGFEEEKNPADAEWLRG